MTSDLTRDLDALLQRVTADDPGVPGVAAVVTDRSGNVYEGAAGKRRLDGDVDFTPDTTCAIFSTTKAVAGTAVLQLVEEGRLDLDAPAKEHAPAIGELEVLDGFEEDGTPRTRPPRRDVTTRMLLTHTAGFGYDFFNADYLRLATEQGQPASSRPPTPRSAPRSSSSRASGGSTARTSTGQGRSWRGSRGSGSARSSRSGCSGRSAWTTRRSP